MEKKAQLYEIIIKLSFAVFSFIAAIFVVKNVLHMLPLFKTSSLEEFEIFYDFIDSSKVSNSLKKVLKANGK